MKRTKIVLLVLVLVLVLVFAFALTGCKKGIPLEQSVESIYVKVIDSQVTENSTIYTIEIENTSSKDILNLDVKMYLPYSSTAIEKMTEAEVNVNDSFIAIFRASEGIILKTGQSLEYNFSYKKEVIQDSRFDHDHINILATGYLGFESDVTGFEIDGPLDGFDDI